MFGCMQEAVARMRKTQQKWYTFDILQPQFGPKTKYVQSISLLLHCRIFATLVFFYLSVLEIMLIAAYYKQRDIDQDTGDKDIITLWV